LAALPETSVSALDSAHILDEKSKQLNDELGFLNNPIGVDSKSNSSKDPFSGNLEDLFAGMGIVNATA